MDEDSRNKYKDEEKEPEIKEVEIDKEKGKKEEEIITKKRKAFFFGQSKDSMEDSSEWGAFRIRSAESLEILEDESFYRTPLTTIIENETGYYFLVELPGLDKKHVSITLQEEILEILGEKAFKQKKEKEEKKKNEKKEEKDKKDKHKEKKDKKKEKYKNVKGDFLRREFRSPSFYRSFKLPEEINSEGIDASFKNGVLRLRIPKKLTAIAGKSKIEIK